MTKTEANCAATIAEGKDAGSGFRIEVQRFRVQGLGFRFGV